MLKNLKAEMARHEIRIGEISDYLGVRKATVSDKINGHYKFSFDDAVRIKRKFFPALDIEYLFANDDVEKAG
ncbi:hypothetical protein MACH08_05010 [Oceanobacillus kimchii]|uniref:XRE family transcriptional regulator n=2 Tax=Oceanobacillus kimchii TaxID=746691 RepID=A0ABQ5TF92_9BACI|nr:helix-turn-helix transcriptional regulator [Oceanobacillus kimchii]GLO64717.1 hypothetical protein MACH08_05010 [Oceanobacillus kimchii]